MFSGQGCEIFCKREGPDKRGRYKHHAYKTVALFGVSYEVKDDLIVSFDAQYVNDPDFTRTSVGLRLNYNF